MAKTTLRIAAKTDEGMVRDHNEDTVAVREPKDEAEAQAKGYLLMVADGMGGHAAGEVASKLAAETILEEYYRHPETNVEMALDQAFQIANDRIHAAGEEGPGQSGMGTTCAAVVVRGNIAHIAHVGDSRVYLIREGKIRQLTEDHSWVQEQVRAQILNAEEARNHPMRNIITRALGNTPEIAVEFSSMNLKNNDHFLLCSDGLSNMVSDEQMAGTVLEEPDLEAACDKLIKEANRNGGPDNISVVVAAVQKQDVVDEITQPMTILPVNKTASEDKLATTAEMDLGELASPSVPQDQEATAAIGETVVPLPAVAPPVEKDGTTPTVAAPRPPLIKPAGPVQAEKPPSSAVPASRPKPQRVQLRWVAFFVIVGGVILITLAAGAFILLRGADQDLERGPGSKVVATATAGNDNTSAQSGVSTSPLPSFNPAATATSVGSASPGAPAASGGTAQGQAAVSRQAVARGNFEVYAQPTQSSRIAGEVSEGERLTVVAVEVGPTVTTEFLGNNVIDGVAWWYSVTDQANRLRAWLPAHWVELR